MAKTPGRYKHQLRQEARQAHAEVRTANVRPELLAQLIEDSDDTDILTSALRKLLYSVTAVLDWPTEGRYGSVWSDLLEARAHANRVLENVKEGTP